MLSLHLHTLYVMWLLCEHWVQSAAAPKKKRAKKSFAGFWFFHLVIKRKRTRKRHSQYVKMNKYSLPDPENIFILLFTKWYRFGFGFFFFPLDSIKKERRKRASVKKKKENPINFWQIKSPTVYVPVGAHCVHRNRLYVFFIHIRHINCVSILLHCQSPFIREKKMCIYI